MRVLVLVLAAAAAAATTNATFVCVPRRAQLPAGYAQKHYCEQTPTRGRKWGRKCETASFKSGKFSPKMIAALETEPSLALMASNSTKYDMEVDTDLAYNRFAQEIDDAHAQGNLVKTFGHWR